MSWYIRKKPAKMLQFQYPNQPSTIYKRPITLGLLRETYSKWERRGEQNEMLIVILLIFLFILIYL
jgi:hypothetical protein